METIVVAYWYVWWQRREIFKAEREEGPSRITFKGETCDTNQICTGCQRKFSDERSCMEGTRPR
jgi:hypothetical protein